MKTGTMVLPLHGGKAPYWLFSRMKNLSREIIMIMVSEYGAAKFWKEYQIHYGFRPLVVF
jgi:uncharacterized protein